MPIEPQISFLEHVKLMIEAETRVILERLRGMDLQQKNDAAELARRLEELNGAHKKAEADRGMFVEKLVYEPWRDTVNEALTEMKGSWRWTAGIASLIASLIVGVVLMLAHKVVP